MSVYRPKNSPHWHFDFVIKGTRFYGSTGTASRRAAEAVEAKLRTEAAEGVVRRKPVLTLDRAAAKYWDEVAKHQASAKTTEYQLANLCSGLGTGTLLQDLSGQALVTYVSKRRAKVSDASVNREVELLRRVMKRAEKVWAVDVAQIVWKDVLLPESAGRVRELSAAEEAALFDHLRADMHAMVRFSLATGVRLSNAIRLTWPQVDFDAGVIRLVVKSRMPGGQVHYVPLVPQLVALLSAERGRHPVYVFTYEVRKGRGGRKRSTFHPYTQTGWRKSWGQALKAAGIDDFRWHDLRHTAATRTLRASQNLKVVQSLLGHKDIATTARYAHAMLADVAAAMDAVLSRNSPEAVKVKNTKSLKTKA
jgi:integrase